MPTSLVTGAAGFIGSHVADQLLENGHSVVALDDLSGGFADNVHAKAAFVEGSILDTTLIGRLFSENQFDYVFHLAAYAAEGLSHFIRRFNYTNNLIGSVNLINESVKHDLKCFVFTSSIAVYGRGQLPMTEDMTPMPEDPYGISKYAVEQDLKAAHEMFGLNSIIFRPHNVYGERQNIGDPYRNVIGIFMNQILQGKPLSVFGDGGQTRAFTYIGDIAPAIAGSVTCPEAANQVFNIGSDKAYTVIDLAEMISEAMGVKLNVEHLPSRNEVLHAFSSHEKIKSLLGAHIASSDLRVGIDRMVNWVRTVGARQGEPFRNIEVSKRMPPSWLKLTQ